MRLASRHFLPGARWVYEVRKPKGTGWAGRKYQLEAVERWYLHGWSRLDGRLRSSIVEGVVVFLSLFDDSPAVHRAFCPPRSAYTEEPPPGEPKPLARSTNCWRAEGAGAELSGRDESRPCRILGVMLKLDFQRAVLQRIRGFPPIPNVRGETCCLSATSTTPLPPSGKRTRPATNARSRSLVRPG